MVVQAPGQPQGRGGGGGRQKGYAVPPKMQGWDLLRSFCDHSSLPGLKYLAERRRPWPERLVWLTGLVLALAVCSALVLQTWTRWRNSTVILQESVSHLPFPAVTLCPDVKIDTDRLQLYDLLERYHKHNVSQEESDIIEDLALVCPLAGFTRNYHFNLNKTRPSTAVENIEKYALPIRHYVASSYLYLNFRDVDDLFRPIITEEGLCYSFNMIPGKLLFANNTFHASRNYLNHNPRKWQTHWPGATLRTDAEGNPLPLRTVGSGRNSAFYLHLQDLPLDQINPCGNSNGFQVLVHGAGEMPRPSHHAIHVPRGAAADVAVSPSATWTDERVRHAYSPRERQCFFREERALRFFRVYSQSNCELECLANFTLRLCGCVDFYMPRTTNTSLCTFSPGSMCMEYASWRMQQAQTGTWTELEPAMQGLTRAISEQEERAMQCNCLQECDHVQYDAHVSYRPALPAHRKNKAGFPAMLTVFIENTYYNPMRRIELFGTIDFIANCGGLLGLCLGFSVLSIVEVLYWLLVRPLCQRRFSKRTQARDHAPSGPAPAHKDFAVFALAPPRQH